MNVWTPCCARGSLQYLSVPLVTIFKNVTNIIILVGDWYFFKQPTSAPIVLSLLLMLAGAVMAGFADIAFSAVGYTWMALNCLATASYGARGRVCAPICQRVVAPALPALLGLPGLTRNNMRMYNAYAAHLNLRTHTHTHTHTHTCPCP
jgi:drug/metabolite transporter (DMT)-like permease